MENIEERVEIRAIRFAEDYYSKKGWVVKNVSRLGAVNSGFDLLLEKGDEQRKIEVKGCSTLYGIPDPYFTEFDESLRLVADELCIVYFLPDGERKLAIIPREKIPVDYVIPRRGFRISGKFKNEREMAKFIEEVD